MVKFTFKNSGSAAGVAGGAGGSGGSVGAPAATTAASASNKNNAPVFNPPRSCSGRFQDTSTIVCKPPKFAEAGVYSVSVSMDGVSFLDQTVEIYIHQELSVQRQLPEMLDLSVTPVVPELELVSKWHR